MHAEAHRDHLQDQFHRENVTENYSDRLQPLIVLLLIVPVAVVCHGEDRRVKKDGQDNHRVEYIALSEIDDPPSKPCLVVE